MSKLRGALLGALLVLAFAPASAGADGGPSPGVSYGWDGVLGPHGELRYVTFPAGRSTLLAVVRVRDGRVLRFGTVRGAFGIPLVTYDGATGGLSRDGTTIVLGSQGSGPHLRAATRLAVVDTHWLRTTRSIVLRGDFSYDALSPDGRTLYLIQHLRGPGGDLSRYVVRAYDLWRSRLHAKPIADRVEDETEMSGSPLHRATSADGSWVYTLYQGGSSGAFVHALDTVHGVAVCVDVPWRAAQDDLWKVRLGLDDAQRLVLRGPGGRELGVVDTAHHRFVAR